MTTEMLTIQVAKCSIEGCNRAAASEGLCASHYRRKKLYGDPLKGARAFSGLETTVIGISIPNALVEAIKAEPITDSKGQPVLDEEGKPKTKRVATVLAHALFASREIKERLASLNIDLSVAAASVATRKRNGEGKPRKKLTKKDAA